MIRLLLAGLLGLVLGLCTWTRPADPSLRLRPGETAVVGYVLDNGFHTDLALPRAALASGNDPLGEATRGLEAGDWVLVGWGDARFYVDQSPIHHRLADGARAFFRPGGNPSVLMLDPEQVHPERMFAADGRRTIRFSPEGFRRLRARLNASLDQSAATPRVAATRPGSDVRFFDSVETFSILHLCNHWSAEVLGAAGLASHPARAVRSAEIVAMAERSARLDTAAARP
jgi:hypothetical protein